MPSKRSVEQPQAAELDDLYVTLQHGQLIILRADSAIGITRILSCHHAALSVPAAFDAPVAA